MKRLVLAALLAVAAQGGTAQEFPSKQITIVVPFPPGGSTDVQARLIAKGMSDRFGKPVVVENKPGAAGAIGARAVAAADADGYTLLFASISSLVTEPVLNAKAGFDPLKDFVPVSLLTDMPFLFVVPCTASHKSLADVMTSVRAKPGGLNYGSWGYGSSGNLLGEMFKFAAKLDIVHVPYKGEAPALTGLMGGETAMMFLTPVNMPQVTSGRVCPLGVTGAKRMAVLPNVPTFQESGVKGVDLNIWFGIVAPARTNPEIVTRLHKEIAGVAESPEFVKTATTMGVTAVGSTPADFARRIKEDLAAIANLAKVAKLRE